MVRVRSDPGFTQIKNLQFQDIEKINYSFPSEIINLKKAFLDALIELLTMANGFTGRSVPA